jgi:hypothetical protein
LDDSDDDDDDDDDEETPYHNGVNLSFSFSCDAYETIPPD